MKGFFMIVFNQPEDIIGIGIKNILGYRKDDARFQKLVQSWKRIIAIEFKNLYCVTANFQGDKIDIMYGESPKYHLKIIMDSLQTMGDLAKGKIGPYKAFLLGKIKVKKIWHVFDLLKFIKVFIPGLRIAGDIARSHRNE